MCVCVLCVMTSSPFTRLLLGWGVQKITFVDNGKVSRVVFGRPLTHVVSPFGSLQPTTALHTLAAVSSFSLGV